MKKIIVLLISICSVLVLTSCSSDPKEESAAADTKIVEELVATEAEAETEAVATEVVKEVRSIELYEYLNSRDFDMVLLNFPLEITKEKCDGIDVFVTSDNCMDIQKGDYYYECNYTSNIEGVTLFGATPDMSIEKIRELISENAQKMEISNRESDVLDYYCIDANNIIVLKKQEDGNVGIRYICLTKDFFDIVYNKSYMYYKDGKEYDLCFQEIGSELTLTMTYFEEDIKRHTYHLFYEEALTGNTITNSETDVEYTFYSFDDTVFVCESAENPLVGTFAFGYGYSADLESVSYDDNYTDDDLYSDVSDPANENQNEQNGLSDEEVVMYAKTYFQDAINDSVMAGNYATLERVDSIRKNGMFYTVVLYVHFEELHSYRYLNLKMIEDPLRGGLKFHSGSI